MPRMSHGSAMSWLAAQSPQRLAVVCESERASRSQLDRRANRLARAYAARGVGKGDLATLALPNGIEFLAACLALWKLGAAPQPISSRLPAAERRDLVALAKPALVIGAAEGEFGAIPALPPGFAPDPALPDHPLPDITPPHSRVMSSGGSTGRPKLIVDLAPALTDPTRAENFMRVGGTTLAPGPLYHAGPFLVSWQCLLSGGCVVLMQRFDAERCLALIEEQRVEWVLFVPTMMSRIWKLPEAQRNRRDLSSLRTVMCTGAPSPAWLKRAWIEWLGAEKIYEAYGGTERIAGTIIRGDEWLAHPGSVGKPPPERGMRALRPDGSRCAPGEVGEIYMKPAGGQGSTYRYIGAEAAAAQDGWESLGDLGHFDGDGYLYLADRKTDMIIVGGANVFPAEVEAALELHPEVRSSAVIGLPDADLGQRIHAIVDAPQGVGEEALREHMARQLARFKTPRSYEFIATPLRDDAGKLRRSALRAERLARNG